MSRFITSLLVFAAFYYPLRLLKDNWERLSLPSWCVIPAGIMSWGLILCLGGIGYAVVAVCAQVVISLTMGAAGEAVGVFFLIGIVANLMVVHTEILDWDRMSPFIRTSMMFRRYFNEHNDLFVQLEKKQIRDIHRETTGRELVEEEKKKAEIVHTDPETARRSLEQARLTPVQSAHLEEEIRQLTAGECLDVTDTFTVNVFKHPTHTLYKDTRGMRIDPTARILSCSITFVRITKDAALTNDQIYHVKQDLYDELQALISEQWLKPYAIFFDRISVTCHRVRRDSFDQPYEHPFMRVDIAVSELRARDQKIFSVGDLHTIATITMLEAT